MLSRHPEARELYLEQTSYLHEPYPGHSGDGSDVWRRGSHLKRRFNELASNTLAP